MKNLIPALFFIFLVNLVNGQTCIYKGNSTYASDCIGMVTENKFYAGRLAYPSECRYTFTESQMYTGNSTYSSDVAYRLDENKVYLMINNRSYLIYTISENKVYLGNSTASSECIYTMRDNKVYLSNGHCCVASFDGPVSIFILACILGPY